MLSNDLLDNNLKLNDTSAISRNSSKESLEEEVITKNTLRRIDSDDSINNLDDIHSVGKSSHVSPSPEKDNNNLFIDDGIFY